jgi:oxygen-dependent protoporphyrinogen oxidase
MTPRRVAVIGAGIAGLSAAYALPDDIEATVLDAALAPGGRLRSDLFRNRPVDLGPDAFITRNDAAEQLCRALGLGDELIAPSANRAAIFARGRLRPFPAGLALGVPTDLPALARSGIVSPRGVARAALDLVLPGRAAPDFVARATAGTDDPTIAHVVGRRLGCEVLRALVDPLIGGINASDVAQLSFVAAAPQLAASLAGERSMARALRPRPPTPGATPRPVFLGLQRGLGSLVDALVEELARRGTKLSLETAVAALSWTGTHWHLETDAGPLAVDGIVLAVPAPAAAALLVNLDPALAADCGAIPYAGVVTVTLAWNSDAVPPRTAAELEAIVHTAATSSAGSAAVLPGSGVLIPRTSGHLITAATFTSTKWPRSANPGEIVIRASAGRHDDERALALDDDALVDAVRADLSEILGIVSPPLETRIVRHPASFPQYVSGHLARVGRIHAATAALPPLALCGAAFDGIGIPACIVSGRRAASAVVAALAD